MERCLGGGTPEGYHKGGVMERCLRGGTLEGVSRRKSIPDTHRLIYGTTLKFKLKFGSFVNQPSA